MDGSSSPNPAVPFPIRVWLAGLAGVARVASYYLHERARPRWPPGRRRSKQHKVHQREGGEAKEGVKIAHCLPASQFANSLGIPNRVAVSSPRPPLAQLCPQIESLEIDTD